MFNHFAYARIAMDQPKPTQRVVRHHRDVIGMLVPAHEHDVSRCEQLKRITFRPERLAHPFDYGITQASVRLRAVRALVVKLNANVSERPPYEARTIQS